MKMYQIYVSVTHDCFYLSVSKFRHKYGTSANEKEQ
jgi:hypothetical protein